MPTKETGMSARFRLAVESELAVAELFAALGASFLEPQPLLLERLRALAARSSLLPAPFADESVALWHAAEQAGIDALRTVHERHFGHIPQAGAAPYETLHAATEVFQQSAILADIAGFYRAFGVDVCGEQPERVDHVALELEFVGLLIHRTVTAPDDEAYDVTLHARRSFLNDHISRFAPMFFAGLAGGDDFHACAARLAGRLLAWEAERVGASAQTCETGDAEA
jgi:TorA maturation chaperone TorD